MQRWTREGLLRPLVRCGSSGHWLRRPRRRPTRGAGLQTHSCRWKPAARHRCRYCVHHAYTHITQASKPLSHTHFPDREILQSLAALVEERSLAARKVRENSIVPLCGVVDRRRNQIVQALEDGNACKSQNRQMRGQIEQVQHHLHVVEAERDALVATYETCLSVKFVPGVCESSNVDRRGSFRRINR